MYDDIVCYHVATCIEVHAVGKFIYASKLSAPICQFKEVCVTMNYGDNRFTIVWCITGTKFADLFITFSLLQFTGLLQMAVPQPQLEAPAQQPSIKELGMYVHVLK